MKIRTGFVSNSSSSSFLVCYENFKDFERYSKFEGYEFFKKDMESVEVLDENVRSFIFHMIKDYFYTSYYNNFNPKEYTHKKLDDIYDIFKYGEINIFNDDGLFDEAFHKFNSIRKQFWKNLKKKDLELFNFTERLRYFDINIQEVVHLELDEEHRNIWNDSVMEYDKKVMKFYKSKKFKEIIENSIDELMKNLKHFKFNMKSITYEDDNKTGSFMEHCFMPLMCCDDPEAKIQVFQMSNH